MKGRGVSVIIHCGDICRPSALKVIERAELSVFCAFGNMDNPELLKREFLQSKNVTLFGVGAVNIDRKKVGFVHFPHIAESLALEGRFDAVFHGHTHRKREEMLNGTLIVNPGEIAGLSNKLSFVIYDTKENKVDFVDL